MERGAIDCARVRRDIFLLPVCRQSPRGHRVHNAAYAPKAAISENRTRSTIVRANLRSSIFLAFSRAALLSPTICVGARKPNLVEDTPNYCIHDCGYGTGTAVERRNRRQHNRSRLE